MVYSALVVITRDTASNSIFCLDSCCTVPVGELRCEWAELYMRWIRISPRNVYICILHKSHGRRWPGVFFSPPKVSSFTFVDSSHRAFLNDIFCISPHEFWGGTLHKLRGSLLSIQPESETWCATIPQRDNQWPSYCYEFHPHPAIRMLVYLESLFGARCCLLVAS